MNLLIKFLLLFSATTVPVVADEQWINVYKAPSDSVTGSKSIDIANLFLTKDNLTMFNIRREVKRNSGWNSWVKGAIFYDRSDWGAVDCKTRSRVYKLTSNSIYAKGLGLKKGEIYLRRDSIDADPKIYASKTNRKIFKLVCSNSSAKKSVSNYAEDLFKSKSLYPYSVHEKELNDLSMSYEEYQVIAPKMIEKKRKMVEEKRKEPLRIIAKNNGTTEEVMEKCMQANDFKRCLRVSTSIKNSSLNQVSPKWKTVFTYREENILTQLDINSIKGNPKNSLLYNMRTGNPKKDKWLKSSKEVYCQSREVSYVYYSKGIKKVLPKKTSLGIASKYIYNHFCKK